MAAFAAVSSERVGHYRKDRQPTNPSVSSQRLLAEWIATRADRNPAPADRDYNTTNSLGALLLSQDLKRAGIERKDGLGRVVHFHSFRKTMQSLGVRYGINQRAAQEILGHSDANLTARIYTDVGSLQLHREIAKLPWISPLGIEAQHGAKKSGVSGQVVALTDILRQLQQLAQATGTDG